MPENNVFRANQLIAAAILVIALAAVFFVGQSLGDSSDAAATVAAAPASSTTETFGVVTGAEASVNGIPDQLSFTASVHNTAATNADALAKTIRGTKAIIRAARTNGVEAHDTQTSGPSVRPDYEYSNGRRELVGYTASQSVRFLVRELDDAGTVVGAVTDAGGNAVSVGSTSLSISNRDALVATARAKAVKKSKAAAEALAKAAGREVGELEYVEEVGPRSIYDYDQSFELSSRRLVAGAALAAPIRPGKQQVSVTVKVRWALAGQ